MTGHIAKPADEKAAGFSCPKCQKKPNVGQMRYYQNLGTKENARWVGCIDLDCFVSQGGSREKSQGFAARKKRSAEEARAEVQKLLAYAAEDASKTQLDARGKEILGSVLLKAMVELMK
jgi:hypothetical protein